MKAQETEELTRARLDRVKRLILQAGARCTYSSKYNHNPCLRTAEFHLYLDPDPGPDGHPQWNLDSDPAVGDFHTLVVRRRSGEDGWGSVQFLPGQDRKTLALNGREKVAIGGLDGVELRPHMTLALDLQREDGSHEEVEVLCRIDTQNEVEYFKAGGILHHVLRQMLKA